PPLRKRSSWRIPERHNQLPYPSSPPHQLANQLFQFIPLSPVPFRRDLLRRLPHHLFLHLFHSRQPRLKLLPSPHRRINFIPRINPPQRIIRKRPLPRIKTIPLINERRRIPPLAHLPPERRLPAVSISHPFIYGQHPRKRLEVPHPLQHSYRQIIK